MENSVQPLITFSQFIRQLLTVSIFFDRSITFKLKVQESLRNLKQWKILAVFSN